MEGGHWEHSDDGEKRSWQIAGCILGQRQSVPPAGLLPTLGCYLRPTRTNYLGEKFRFAGKEPAEGQGNRRKQKIS